MLTKGDLGEIDKLFSKRINAELKPVRKEIQDGLKSVRVEMQSGFGSVRQDLNQTIQTELGSVKEDFRRSMKSELKPIKNDISQIRRDIKTIVGFFDREYLDLRKRVERIEEYLHLSASF